MAILTPIGNRENFSREASFPEAAMTNSESNAAEQATARCLLVVASRMDP